MEGVPTEKLFYTDCYLANFEARVLDTADSGQRVYLDRTAFYPTSGGQPHDLGTLAGAAVLDVVDEEDAIAHVVSSPITQHVVEGVIDWPRRYDHMQQHTGQHLLSAVFVELLGTPTLSFHMASDISTIELGATELTETQIDSAEDRANQIVREARPVTIAFEQAESVQNLRKPSARTGTLRIIEIDGVDRSACGGTHVRSTAELGPIQIRKSEKMRGHVRLEFVCGVRALRRTRQDFRIAADLARLCSTPIDRLPEHVATLRQRLADAEKQCQRTSIELARREGEALYQAHPPSSDGLHRLLLRVSEIDEAARAKAQAFTNSGKAIALILASERGAVLIAASPDSGRNAGAILKAVLAKAGGRGGGSATLAQGSLPAPDAAGPLLEALGFEPNAS